jgi:hypothetical protein
MFQLILIFAILASLGVGLLVWVLWDGLKLINGKPTNTERPGALWELKQKYKDRDFDGDFRL